MDIKYKIIETFPEEHQVLVRFYSDQLPESQLVSAYNQDGSPRRYRTDYLVTLPVPAPTGVDLEKFIMAYCPVGWFELKAKIADATIDTSLSYLAPSFGQEKVVTVNAPISFNKALENKLTEITAKRDKLESTTFTYLGKLFDCDTRSVQRINTVVQAVQAAASVGQSIEIDWTCADNSILRLNSTTIMGLPVALANHANVLHQYAKGLKSLCTAPSVDTKEKLAAINIETGWPE
jgi:hypothetical protein